jgi:rRNA-processing protein FCF1
MQLAERQQLINQSIQMEGLYREVVTTLASVAVARNDQELKGLLASQGINLDGAPKAPGGAK